MIWLVEWRRIIVQHAYTCSTLFDAMFWCCLPNDDVKFSYLRFWRQHELAADLSLYAFTWKLFVPSEQKCNVINMEYWQKTKLNVLQTTSKNWTYDYFSSFNQSDHCFLASSLLKLPNRSFATSDHAVQNPPRWRASSLLFPHWDIKTKRPEPVKLDFPLFWCPSAGIIMSLPSSMADFVPRDR